MPKIQVTDEEIAALLRHDGFSIEEHTVGCMRREAGLFKRTSASDVPMLEDKIREVLVSEFDKGTVNSYGRNDLYDYVRWEHPQYHNTGRDRVYQIAREFNPDAVESRAKGVRGPNFVWSMDAHSKLEFWGVQVYAVIDEWSRCVMWTYVDITGRSAVSVLKQYVSTLAEGTRMPLWLRSDRGAETTLTADCHYDRSLKTHNKIPEELAFADCFRYGTSKANQRIESWWDQLSKSVLVDRGPYFENLAASGDYNNESDVDRIAFLAVYVPIMRIVVTDFDHT
ncbi:hypothetical protein K470DRAFT_267100 [Piedraia hortae CBS 480.64]|uniref:Integrase core domain-containing protein n=1 Tax=Piedraia hortae CBS 480.64 TaxID=1314780 RepID=A0A6A7BNR7_9PEZI|nr:hypothetical protein K470DRAFT_267100 [Piedraia hortae CBS 480.64]